MNCKQMLSTLALAIFTNLSFLPGAALADPPTPIAKSSVAHVEAQVPAHKATNVVDTHDVHYSPQAGWAIISYNVYDTGSYGTTTKSWSSNPANFYSSMSSQLDQSYQTAFQLINNANIANYIKADMLVQLNNSYALNASYVSSIQSSQAQIVMIATAKGRGVANFQGGSLIGLSLDVVEVPILDYCMSQDGWNTQIVAPVKSALRRATLLTRPATEASHVKQALFTADETDLLTGQVGHALLAMAPLYSNGDALRAFVRSKSGLTEAPTAIARAPKATAKIKLVETPPAGKQR